ncbi:MAG: DUF4143 domain-containing protein [Deltaproteobacteria bacterium]|nr:DUF4143 domain-containing protein [Deltaproteobacteria bacterium]
MKRAREYHPDMQDSVNEQFSLEQVLQWGSLPLLYHTADAPDKIRYLRTYTQTYLKEEIVAEQIIRKLNPFRLFLEIAAQHNGEIANYSNIARDVGVDTVTIQSYFQILEDTLVGFSKFYYFDLGIKRSLDGTVVQPLVPNTYGYGKAFEHFVILEAVRLNAYLERDFRFSYLLTKDGAEIDLIIERPGMPVVLVEIKSSGNVDERDTRTVERFLKDFKKGEGYCWSLDPIAKKIGSVRALHWREGLKEVGLAPLSP